MLAKEGGENGSAGELKKPVQQDSTSAALGYFRMPSQKGEGSEGVCVWVCGVTYTCLRLYCSFGIVILLKVRTL